MRVDEVLLGMAGELGARFPERAWRARVHAGALGMIELPSEASFAPPEHGVIELAGRPLLGARRAADAGVHLSTRGGAERRGGQIERTIRSPEGLASVAPAFVEALGYWLDRLTAHALQPGRTYRLLQGLAGLPAGARLEFLACEHVPSADGSVYRFLSNEGEILLLTPDPAQLAVLRDLDLYLEPEAPR